MILLPPDFKEFLQLLNDHQVEYLLLGGYAVGYHGYPRATGDMGNPPLRIEVLTSASGVEFSACYAKRILEIIDGVEVPIIALDDLKQNKQASGRLKDLNDLANLP